MPKNVHLDPPFFNRGELAGFLNSNHAFSSTFSPRGNSLAVFATAAEPEKRPHAPRTAGYPHDRNVYFASWDVVQQERREFIAETYVTYDAFNHEVASQKKPSLLDINKDTIKLYAVHAQVYLGKMRQYLLQLSGLTTAPEAEIEHFHTLYETFHLFQTIYVPHHGGMDVVVGRELLHWLNTHFVAPSSEEGLALANLQEPWKDDNFWPFLARSTLRGLLQSVVHFFSIILKRHPSFRLQDIARKLIPLLESHPTSEAYQHEREFFDTLRRWKERFLTFRRELSSMSGDGEDWWDGFQDVVGILDGRKDVIERLCTEGDYTWRELICVWGVWVHPGLRREDLPDLCTDVFEILPLDSTRIDEEMQSALLMGDPAKALALGNEMDRWLVAHMADMMEPLGLLQEDDRKKDWQELGFLSTFSIYRELTQLPSPDISIRQHFLLAYAEHILSDPSLWRIAVAYMSACGAIGSERAGEVLLRVPLQLDIADSKSKALQSAMDGSVMEETAAIKGDALLEDLTKICQEYGLEDVRRTICRSAAQILLRKGSFGKAIAYSIHAGDVRGVARLSEVLLDELIEHGAARFLSLVNQIPTEHLYPEHHGLTADPYHSRLQFVIRYAEVLYREVDGQKRSAADYLALMFDDEVVPRSWWAVLLVDAARLLDAQESILDLQHAHMFLRRLEEVCSQVEFGSSVEYLTVLRRMMKTGKGTELEALQKLEVIRLSLARTIAQGCVVAVGGRGPILEELLS